MKTENERKDNCGKCREGVKMFFGLCLVASGIMWILYILGIVNFNLFFDGWWSLFIIVPCTVKLFTDKDKIGAGAGICLGILLLLVAQAVIDWNLFWKIGLGIMILAAGAGCIFGKNIERSCECDVSEVMRDGLKIRLYNCAFGRQSIDCDNEPFEGADIRASFAEVRIDLRKAIITDDIVMKFNCNFCGVELILPDNVNVKPCGTNSAFGGISVKRNSSPDPNAKTVFIYGTVSFAGITIR